MSSNGEASVTYFSGNQAIQTLFPTIKALLTRPRIFFEQMPRAIYRRDAIFFATIVIFGFSFLSVPFYSMLLLFLLPLTWGLALVGLWLWSQYLRWAVRTFTGSKLSMANAFQLSAYAALPMVLATIPYVGILAGLWSLYLLWLGLIGYCKISGGKAAMVLFVPLAVLAASTAVLVSMLMQALPQLGG